MNYVSLATWEKSDSADFLSLNAAPLCHRSL